MKYLKALTALVCLSAFLGSATLAQAGCCDDAKKNGKECTHPCCKKAAKDGKTCEKCNPKKEEKK